MRVLVVEDDAKIAAFVAKGLKQAGFAVDQAADGEEGLQLALMSCYDALVIDVMLPKLDGLTLINRVRQKGVDAPVIILSAKRSVDDRVKGLQTGSDDSLTKPFSFSELLARLQAREQFGKRERLGEVIIRARLQTFYAIVHRPLRAQDDDGRVDPFLTDPVDEGETVELGQHDIDHERVVTTHESELQAFLAVGGLIDREARLLQAFGHESGDLRVVLYD